MLTVILKIYTLFTTKAAHYIAVLIILSARRSLLTSEFMISSAPICKIAVSIITSVWFKVERIYWWKYFDVAPPKKPQLQLAL